MEKRRIPRNDIKYLDTVRNRYANQEGVAHGLQKDAIQNCVGATTSKKFNRWSVTFELFSVAEEDCLSITDEGTTGLTGADYTDDDLSKLSAEGSLIKQERLGRFRSLYNSSNDQDGAGSFGQGKLMYTIASRKREIIVESRRSDDDKYLCFSRTVDGSELVQSQVFWEAEAEQFVEDRFSGRLLPLEQAGTRITICDVDDCKQNPSDPSLKELIVNSFDQSEKFDYENRLDSMIVESWWELLMKYPHVQIMLKWNGKEKNVKIPREIEEFLNPKKKNERIKEKIIEQREFEANGEFYNIKTLRFFLVDKDNTLPEPFQRIVINRKLMSIGQINKTDGHPSASKRFGGYVMLSRELERKILDDQAENDTHYGFNGKKNIIKSLKKAIVEELRIFEEEQNIGVNKSLPRDDRTLDEVLNDINDLATDLGFSKGQGGSFFRNSLKISISDLGLPNDSTRIDYGESIGPVHLVIRNLSSEFKEGHLSCWMDKVKGGKHCEIGSQKFKLDGGESLSVVFPEFQVPYDLPVGAVWLLFEINRRTQRHQLLWLNQDPPPVKDDYLVECNSFVFDLPNANSKRVNLDQGITDIRVSLCSKASFPIAARIVVDVEDCAEGQKVCTLLEKIVSIKPSEDIDLGADDLLLHEHPKFLEIKQRPPRDDQRKCRVKLRVLSAKNDRQNLVLKGNKLSRHEKVDFYIEQEEPGESIFSAWDFSDNTDENRKAWYSGSSTKGYTLYVNMEHPSYKSALVRSEKDETIKKTYLKEEALRQALTLTIENSNVSNNWKGLYQEKSLSGAAFFEILTDSQSDNVEIINAFEELHSLALKKISD